MSTVALVLVPALLLAGLLAVNAAWLVDARSSLQGSSDAAALAAARMLADDDYLRHDHADLRHLLGLARDEARHFAHCNPVHGCPLELQRNDDNDPDGDIVFGILDRPRGHFRPARGDHDHEHDCRAINAVRVHARRTRGRGNPITLFGCFGRCQDFETRSTAMLDDRILGFRSVFATPIPLVPIAFFSDHAGVHQHSWEHQVRDRHGRDDWSFNCSHRSFERRGDGLPEMWVHFRHGHGNDGGGDDDQGDDQGKDGAASNGGDRNDGGNGGSDPDNARDNDEQKERRNNGFLCHFRPGSADDFRQQISDGVHGHHLRDFGGELTVGGAHGLRVPGNGWGADSGSELHEAMISGLYLLQRSGEARIWPLYSRIESKHTAIITGFVAARVVRLEQLDDEGGIRLILQPTRLVTATAVTAFDRQKGPEAAAANPYIVKIRLVD